MQLGIFAKTFARPTVEEVFRAVQLHNLNCVQFNMACAGLPSMPDKIDQAICERIRIGAAEHDIAIAAVSGTFNMIHPDATLRRDGLKKLGVLAAACEDVGAPIITLCTGTRDAQDMWKRHADNDSPAAWRDLVAAMREALRVVDGSRMTLAFEPEMANVVDSSLKARRLLDELASPQLRVVLDAANLFCAANIQQMDQVLGEAFKLLAPDIVMAHAKDVVIRSGELHHVAAGTGQLDYDRYLQLLRENRFAGPLILHGLAEEQTGTCVAFLRDKIARTVSSLGGTE